MVRLGKTTAIVSLAIASFALPMIAAGKAVGSVFDALINGELRGAVNWQLSRVFWLLMLPTGGGTAATLLLILAARLTRQGETSSRGGCIIAAVGLAAVCVSVGCAVLVVLFGSLAK